MVWACFAGEKLGLLLAFEKGWQTVGDEIVYKLA